jgi:type IV secretion system protein VirB2
VSRQTRHKLLTAGALLLVAFAASEPAYAQSVLGKADTFLQKVVDALTGTTGKLIATIAVVAFGFAAVFGRIEWTKALIVLVGIAIIVGAPQLVTALWGA